MVDGGIPRGPPVRIDVDDLAGPVGAQHRGPQAAGQHRGEGVPLTLGERLAVPGYEATVGWAVLVAVTAFDWNCPQHSTPRFTAAEIQETVGPLVEEVQRLRVENARPRGEGRAAAQ